MGRRMHAKAARDKHWRKLGETRQRLSVFRSMQAIPPEESLSLGQVLFTASILLTGITGSRAR